MLPRTSATRHRAAAAAAVQPPSGSATVHPELSEEHSQKPQRKASPTKKSRGQQLWGKARGTLSGVDVNLNPDGNTFRPNGLETEDEAREAIIRKRDPLRGKKVKLAAYCVLLVVFLAISMGARPTLDIYSQNSYLENLMMLRVDEESGMKQQALGIAWSFITTEEDFWLYMTEGIPGGLHSDELRPGRELAAVELLTGYRIKQTRVAKVPCEDAHPFQHTRTLSCTPAWEDGEEEMAAYGPGGVWTRSSEADALGSDTTMRGFLGHYPLGGYIVHNVSATAGEFIEVMEWLRENKWVDTQTRQVQIDINVWNPTLRLISAIKLQAEFSVVGKVRTMYSIRTFEYKDLVDTSRLYWWWEMVYVLMVVTYSFEEMYELLKLHSELRKTKSTLTRRMADKQLWRAKNLQGDAKANQLSKVVDGSLQAKREFTAVKSALDDYLRDPWNYLDMTNYVIAAIVIGMELWSRVLVQQGKLDLNEVYPGNQTTGTDGINRHGEFDAKGFFSHFVCFYAAAYLSAYAYTFMGLNAVVTWLKVLKYLNLFPHLSMLSITLRNAVYPVVSFSVMFCIVFLSCGQAFLLAFGSNLRDFSTFGEAMMSLFRAVLGDFDYPSLADADPVVGPVLFTIYIFLVLFVLLNMFIAILTEAYEKAKVEVFGDAVHEREECWEGAIPFLEYVYRAITFSLRWSIPCLHNQYEHQSFESDDEDVDASTQSQSATTGPGSKLSKHASNLKQAAQAMQSNAGFEDWMEARYRAQKLLNEEEGKAEVQEVDELVKAAASPIYHDAYALGGLDADSSGGSRRPVQLMVGSYGLVQLEQNEYTTYIYQTLKQWEFGPKKGRSGLKAGELRLIIEPDEPGLAPTEKRFFLEPSEDMTSTQKCEYISRAMMSCAMAERADTFSTTLALKVLRLQMEQTEAQLQSKVNDIRVQVGNMARHMERLCNPSDASDLGMEVAPPSTSLGRTPTKLPPIENRPAVPDNGPGESAVAQAPAPPTDSKQKNIGSTKSAPSQKSDGGRKPRQP